MAKDITITLETLLKKSLIHDEMIVCAYGLDASWQERGNAVVQSLQGDSTTFPVKSLFLVVFLRSLLYNLGPFEA